MSGTGIAYSGPVRYWHSIRWRALGEVCEPWYQSDLPTEAEWDKFEDGALATGIDVVKGRRMILSFESPRP
eukprot:1508509-Rhodomonas_salina.1